MLQNPFSYLNIEINKTKLKKPNDNLVTQRIFKMSVF